MKRAKAIQVCGTGSGVGKSVINVALCRIFFQDGHSVAPFKAQNMALNSFVTSEGAEIGRAQAVQAYASKIKPIAEINPILIKPTSNTKAQIILLGKPVANMSVYEYRDYKKLVFGKVKESLKKLMGRFEVVVIEGAGSVSEINLKRHDLVNMKIARIAKAPVIIVGDIDKGGVFASLVGTLQLMTAGERRMVKGFIINKFRGDKRLLKGGINFLEKYTGVKVLGVIPYFNGINIPEEDSLSEKSQKKTAGPKTALKIDVIHLPHISNFTDFDALEQEPDVSLRYVKRSDELDSPDLIIIPGTKNTIEDLQYLKKAGLIKRIIAVFQSRPSTVLAGICGGFQMLGERIWDKGGVESKIKKIDGIGVLPLTTKFSPGKILSQVKARHLSSDIEVSGYEIHHGLTTINHSACPGDPRPLFEILEAGNKGAKKYDGIITADKRCWGTYIHGVFDNDRFRRHFLNELRRRKGWQDLPATGSYDIDKEIDKLAHLVRTNIDLDLLYKILLGKDELK